MIADTTTDFQTVDHWEDNKLDRTQSSRMGWSDVALSLSGPVVQDLRTHFTQRWNFIYDEKYSKKATRYARLPDTSSGAQQAQQRGFEGDNDGERGFGGDGESGERGLFGHGHGLRQKLYERVNQYGQGEDEGQQSQSHAEHAAQRGGVDCQITRSSAKWSHNISTEVSTDNNRRSLFLNHANYFSTRSKMHTARSSRTASISSTSRTSSSSLPPGPSRSRSRTRSAQLWSSVLFVQLATARSTR
jgi:phospholipase D1/2